MLRLLTFGTTRIERDGDALVGAATQRRLLALLSVLAASGRAGVSRDKLLLLLWPDTTPERARHNLTQSLYHARRALGCDDLFHGSSDPRLNPERIGTDVAEFAAANERGDLEQVAALYRGPFLDGLYIQNSPEFERWVAAERDHNQRVVLRALTSLGDEALKEGDIDGAIRWGERRVAIDPCDCEAVHSLASNLWRAGQGAGALRQLRVHEAILRQTLDVAPHEDLLALSDRIRRNIQGEPRSPDRSTSGASAQMAVHDRDVVESSPSTHGARGGIRRLHRAKRRVAATVGFVAVLVTTALWRRADASRVPREPLPVTAPAPAGELVVMPFRVSTADPALRYLGEGMVELLTVRLADAASWRAVDAGTILAAWRAAGLLDAQDHPRAQSLRIAESLGARALVEGSVIGSTAHLVLQASLGSPTGETGIRATVEGPADSLSRLVDRLAAQLLISDAGVGEQVQLRPPPPLASVRAFLQGQAAYRRERFPEALEAYEKALSLDSTFALAALRTALTADRLNAGEQHDRALHLAWMHRAELSAPDLAHLVAFAGPRYPSPSTAGEQLYAWNRAATEAPDRAEVWQELGERFFYSGAVIGEKDWRSRAARALERAVVLDPASEGAQMMRVLLAARVGDSTSLRNIIASPNWIEGLGEFKNLARWRVAQALGDAAALDSVRRAMTAMNRGELRALAQGTLFDGVSVDDGARALRLLRAQARRAADRVDVLLAQHSLAMNQGRPVLALDLTEQLEQIQPAMMAHLRLRVLDALYGEGDSTAAVRAVEELSRSLASQQSSSRVDGMDDANRCVVEQWRLWNGHLARAPASIAALRRGSSMGTIPVSTPPRACAELLDALHRVMSRHPRALARVARLDSLMLTGPAVGDLSNYAPLALARMYARLGATQSAVDAIRRRPYMNGWPRYLASARREEGLLARQLGQPREATEVWRRYLALRRPERETPLPGDALIAAHVRSSLGE